jgi:hypothetical protein
MHIGAPASFLLQAATDGERTLAGFKAQCELLAEQLELLVAGCEARQQSLICEGERRHVLLEGLKFLAIDTTAVGKRVID